MGFAKEVSDFLGSATSTYKTLDDAQYNKLKRAYMKSQTAKLDQDMADPTFKQAREAGIAHTQAGTAKLNQDMNDPLKDKLTQSAIGLRNEQALNLKARREGTGGYAVPQPPVYGGEDLAPAPAPMLRPAQPSGAVGPDGPARPQQVSMLDDNYDPGEPDMQPTQLSSKGGMIQKFAIGGMVEDDGYDPEDPDTSDTLGPAPAIGGGPPATDFSSRSRTRPEAGASISHDAGHDAVVDGLKYGVAQLGDPTAVPTQQRQARLQALVRGRGALPLADMNAIYKKIDPENKMGESERNLSAMSAVYQYKLKNGDADGAKKAAFMMLQHYRQASGKYAAIANAAVENGDLQGAALAAAKAYSQVPDGKDLKVQMTKDGQLQYKFIDDKTGETMTQGIASPKEFAAAAMGFAQGGFDQSLLEAAGVRAAKKGAVGGAPKATDLKAAREGVDAHYGTLDQDAMKKTGVTDTDLKGAKSAATHIAQANPSLTGEEAWDAAHEFISSPRTKGKDKDGNETSELPFKVAKDEDSGLNRILFKNGREINMSDAELRPIVAERMRVEQERTDKEKSDEKKKGDKGVMDHLSDAAGSAKDWVVQDLKKAGKNIENAVPTELYDRGKSAIGAVGRAAGDAYDWVKDDLSKGPAWAPKAIDDRK